MPKASAGLVMYRLRKEGLEVLLVHPGGPFWRNKDQGAWSIPKGEMESEENPLLAARREFEEETGFGPQGDFVPLGTVRLKSGKVIHAWAFEGDCDPTHLKSNTFSLEWPPRSGKFIDVPEVDQAAFWAIGEARVKINPAQIPFLDRLEEALRG